MQHNPDNLTPETIETNKGYRLLNEDEIYFGQGKECPDLQQWQASEEWSEGNSIGNCLNITYRTKLTPLELVCFRQNLSLPTAPCHPESKAKPRASLYLIIPKWGLALMLLIDLLCIAILLYILFHLK